VDGEAKPPPNVVEQRRRTERRVVGAKRADNGHHGGVELVGAARATLARDQAGKAVRLERRLGVIERWPGTPEGVGRLRDRVAVDLMGGRIWVESTPETAARSTLRFALAFRATARKSFPRFHLRRRNPDCMPGRCGCSLRTITPSTGESL